MTPILQSLTYHTLQQRQASRRKAYICELVGVTLLIFNAFTWACWNFGAGSPIVQWIPTLRYRMYLQAVCVIAGIVGVVYSKLGQYAGGHLNPAMTLGFWVLNKISAQDALVYVLMQGMGAFLGTGLVRLLFPDLFHSIRGAVTVPGMGVHPAIALGVETVAMFVLMLVVLVLVNSRWMRYTGWAAAVTVALLYLQVVRLTGASLNPVRSLAPAVLAMYWQSQWIYWIAPILGAALAAYFYRLGIVGTGKSYCCKLYHTPDIPCHHHRCGYSNARFIDDFAARKG